MINYNRDLYAKERPYYIIPDNTKSSFRIERIATFSSIEEILNDQTIKSTGIDEKYFDTKYLTEIKKSVQILNVKK